MALVNTGAADDALVGQENFSQLWHTAHTLAGENAGWACELIAACCNRLLARTGGTSFANPFSLMAAVSGSDAVGVRDAADGAPKAFIDQLLPFVFEVLEGNADLSQAPPWRDPVWDPEYYANCYQFADQFLMAMESAFRWLAVNDPGEFKNLAVRLRTSNFETIHFLLSRGYQANGELFADEAIDYVADCMDEFGGRYPDRVEWATAALIEIATPHCSPARLSQLERVILAHFPDYERMPQGSRFAGSQQLILLDKFDEARLSGPASTRLAELRRKFPNPPASGPHFAIAGNVKSPIAEDSARRMKDTHWLGAMAKYHSMRRPPGRDFLKGGAFELSRVLETLTRAEPKRFANLAHQMPDEANTVYFEAILRGLASSDIDVADAVAVCLRCHRLPGRPAGSSIIAPLLQFPDSVLPDEALRMVAWYATQDPDPEPASTGFPGDLLTAGINCVRGSAADSIAKLVFQNRHYFDFFRDHLDAMVHDPSPAVRALVAHVLLATLRHDRDFAVIRFVELCADDGLLATHYVEQFLRYGTQTHFNELEPVLSRMLASDDENIATVGARQSCLASLTIQEAIPLGQRCVSGSKPLRLGAAEVYAANLKDSALRADCEDMLAQLFNDSDDEVRKKAAFCFRGFSSAGLGGVRRYRSPLFGESRLHHSIQSPDHCFGENHRQRFRVGIGDLRALF